MSVNSWLKEAKQRYPYLNENSYPYLKQIHKRIRRTQLIQAGKPIRNPVFGAKKKRKISKIRLVKKRHKELKREIENYKKMGWTFTREHRRSSYYLYRQKTIDGEHKHVPVGAKDWKDLHNKLWDKAQQEVYGENWVGYGLTPSEKETYNWILEDVKSTRMSDRSPIVERYRKQLGMKYNRKNRSSTIDPRLTSQKEKNILKAARKAFLKGVMIASIKREEC